MTRIAIISDIHGNMTALKAVIEDLASFKVDRIIVAGDVVNWGPHNVEVMEHICREGWSVIRGNNELYLLDQDTVRAPASWKRYTISRWTREQLGPDWVNVIATWPDALSLRFPDAPTLRVVHGSPRSHFEGIFASMSHKTLENILNTVDEHTLVSAHTHLPLDRRVGRWHLLNPGSVGMPLSGIMESTYLILDGNWEGWQGTLRHVPFDPTPVLEDFARLNFAEICGPTGSLVIEEYKTARLRVGPFNDWRKQFPDQPEQVLLERFITDVDPWDFTPPDYHIGRPVAGSSK